VRRSLVLLVAARLDAAGARDIGFELAVVIGVEGPHHPVPPNKMRGIVATEELMMLIVVGDADER
jgi:hypothetical protein